LVRPCFSEEIIEEYAAVLGRPKFAFPPEDIAAALAMFRSKGELILPDASAAVSSDPACIARRPPKRIISSPATSAISRRHLMA
jgi:hypothetical protein